MRLLILLILTPLIGGCRLFSRPADNMNDPLIQEIMKNAAVKEIRFKGKIWHVCMDSSTYATVGETLYVDEVLWKQLIQDKRATRLRSLMAHESVHTARQLQMGVTFWMICYFANSGFRWEEEKIAYEAGWRIEVAAGEGFIEADFMFFAEEASGSVYHGMTTYEEAYNFIKETITKLQEELKK